jgi:hypothetical protein
MKKLLLAVGLILSLTSSSFAGAVTATISGGNLYLYGDPHDSNVIVRGAGMNRVEVRGAITPSGQNTVVNGLVNGTVYLTGWTGGIFAYGYEGDDLLTISNAVVRGATHLDLGQGDNEFFLGISRGDAFDNVTGTPVLVPSPDSGPIDFMSTLYLLGLGGSDFVAIADAFVVGNAVINTGDGDDDMYLGENLGWGTINDFRNSLQIFPGAGVDWMDFQSIRTINNLIVDDTVGSMRLEAYDVRVGGSGFVYGTPSNDNILFVGLVVGDLFQTFSESGHDLVRLFGRANAAEVFSGAGNDRVVLGRMVASRVHAQLDVGNDSLTVNGGDIGTLNAFGSSNDDLFRFQNARVNVANLYGDSGFDTYSNGGGNTFGTLRFFSVESR